jgi:hypothetical protein
MKFNYLLTKLILSCCNWSSKEIALENDVQQPKTNKIVAPMKNRRAISPRVSFCFFVFELVVTSQTPSLFNRHADI